MDRLSIILTLMTGAVITGSVVIAAFTMGFQSLWAILLAAVIGLLATWPVSYMISRRIKRQDPNWYRKPEPKVIPDRDAPEV